MREWCACGAAIRSHSYKRVLGWRTNHKHPAETAAEPEKNGSHASVEHAGPRYFEAASTPIVNAKAGFTRD